MLREEIRETERGDELCVMLFDRSGSVRLKTDDDRATDPTISETAPSTGELSQKWTGSSTERPFRAIDSALARAGERVGDPQLDKRLPGHTDSFRFAVDCTQQIHRKVHVYALDIAARARGGCEIKMRAEVLPRVVHLIEARSAEGLSPRGTSLLRLRARGEPR